jgi:branched-subunit amino acid ABC-type transport system permease component
VFGGIVLGIAEELVAAPIWGGEPLISPAYKVGLSFAVMVLLLIVRPTGLFKGQS